MADSELRVTVNAEVRLVPDEATAKWLESIGWTRPVEKEETSDDSD